MFFRCFITSILVSTVSAAAEPNQPYWGLDIADTPVPITSGLLPDKIANPVFTASGKAFYFVDRSDKNIYFTQLERGSWSQPKKAGFSDAGHNAEPFILSDGNRALFISNRAVNGVSKLRIFQSERKSSSHSWSSGSVLLESPSE